MKFYRMLILVISLSCFFSPVFAQKIVTVKGIILGGDKLPLPGVSIQAADGAFVKSGLDGSFTMQTAADVQLTFKYIGFQTLVLSARPVMTIEMKENPVELDAATVVGVGYGTMRKSDLTGAIASVQAGELRKGVITSAEQLLQGKIAGLTVVQPSGDPTQGSSIRLRGGTSLSAANSPLIVVDGIPGVDINTVQPGDILSVDVLKDASAAAIYGSRGANGVIIITTKREGGGATMNYNGYVGVSYVAKNLDLLSADQWRAYVRENNIAGAVDYGGSTNWQKELQRTAITHNNSLSFSNGGKESGMSVSMSYLNTEGVIKTSSLNRLSGSLTGYQYGLNKRLKLEGSIRANKDNYNPVDIGIYERAYNLNPTLPVMQGGIYTQLGGTNANNPVEVLMNRKDDQSRTRLFGFGKAEIEIVDGLKGIVNGSYEYNSQQGRYFVPSYSFNGLNDKGYARKTIGDYNNSQVEAYLNWDKTFATKHKINAMAGYSYLKNVYEGSGAERRGFDSDQFGYDNLGAGSDFRLGDVYSYKGQATLISFFGRVNYVFSEKYMFTGTLRRDGSSRFGDNHKWGLFPSASAAWRISEEEFLNEAKSWLNNLKLRVGYGVTGNQDGIGEYKSLSLMGTGGGAYYDQVSGAWKQSYGITQNPNPDLKWESTAQTNVGIDVSVFNRFNISLDAYMKKTSDLLYTYNVPQPPYLYDKMLANVGDLSNKGIELSIGASLVNNKNFTWNANLALAHNKQTVDRLSNDQYQTDVVSTGSLHGLTGMSGVFTQVLKEGYAVGSFWGPKSVGIDDQGKFMFEKDAAGNVINQYLGNAQPKLTLGFAMDFGWKGFDLNIATYGNFGQKVLNAQAMNISYPGRLPGYNVLDSWLTSPIKEGPVYSDYWIEKGDFLRLQSSTLGYTLPVRNAWFKKIRVYVTGENLFTITGYKGIDPEVNISGLKSPGIDKSVGSTNDGDNYYYPRARTFSFGANVSF